MPLHRSTLSTLLRFNNAILVVITDTDTMSMDDTLAPSIANSGSIASTGSIPNVANNIDLPRCFRRLG